MKNNKSTLNFRAAALAEAIFNTYPSGATFSTTEFTQTVFDSYQGADKWETTNTTSQNKVKHVARWFQQSAKKQGRIVKIARNLWVKTN